MPILMQTRIRTAVSSPINSFKVKKPKSLCPSVRLQQNRKVLAYKEKEENNAKEKVGEKVQLEKAEEEVNSQITEEIKETVPEAEVPAAEEPKAEVQVAEAAKAEVPSKVEERTEKVVSELKEIGFDQEQARKVLQKWEESGAENPDQLRKLFIKGTWIPFLAIGFQILLDVGASYGGFVAAFSLTPFDFFGKYIVQILFYFLGTYFAIGVFFDMFTLGALVAGAINFGTNTQAFYQAVKQIAGDTGIGILDKAKASVNIVRVTQALQSMSDILKSKKMVTGTFSTLENLSAYLTLIKAKENLGFKSEDYQVTDEQAGEIALVFAKYDTNEDYRLELSELKSLVQDLGKELSNEELEAAIEILDKRKSGFIEFDEFVSWWVNSVQSQPAAASEESKTETKN
eukprot:TRINITY_DN811_c0_g1_i7.p1 TRINITY_DN811_c0_g1~~TRINITY_DN811_c0_g1_i7.p1  ORF type:complete len:401 (-),score=83.09 TRINITY_DN811_c0_g1_i7:339-1541(-)